MLRKLLHRAGAFTRLPQVATRGPKMYFSSKTDPDGADRNDYQHPDFRPFHYDKHGRDWADNWQDARNGLEQSPIALYRSHQPGVDIGGDLQVITFDDVEYRHRYGVNHE